MSEIFILCDCGSTRDNHEYRHEFIPRYRLFRNGHIYSINVSEFPDNTININLPLDFTCASCGIAAINHDIIKHPLYCKIKLDGDRNIKLFYKNRQVIPNIINS